MNFRVFGSSGKHRSASRVRAYFLFFFSALASFFSLAVFVAGFFFSFLASLDFMFVGMWNGTERESNR